MVICVILAAGEGKRMRPLTGNRPKVMLPIAGKPMIEHLILAVRDCGITDFILVTGYCKAAVREYFGDGRSFDINIRYVSQMNQKGTGDAVMTVKSFIPSGESFLLLNGDMILEKTDILYFLKNSAPAMGVIDSTHPQDFGVVTIEKERSDLKTATVTGLEEKSENPKTNLVNAGLYLFSSDIFTNLSKITPSPRGELELTDALIPYIENKSLKAVSLSSWSDIGAPWDLLNVHEMSMKNITKAIDGEVEEGVTMHGEVIIGKGTIIKSGTYIEGPCIIGENCIIGPHAYLRPGTCINNNCHIGHSTELKNTIVMDNTNIPHFNYVGDSIIGSGCNFGAGTKVANLRHDKKGIIINGIHTGRRKFGAVIGDDVLFGINCSVNVGSVIGNHTRISPGTIVNGNIADNSVIR